MKVLKLRDDPGDALLHLEVVVKHLELVLLEVLDHLVEVDGEPLDGVEGVDRVGRRQLRAPVLARIHHPLLFFVLLNFICSVMRGEGCTSMFMRIDLT